MYKNKKRSTAPFFVYTYIEKFLKILVIFLYKQHIIYYNQRVIKDYGNLEHKKKKFDKKTKK